MTGGLDPKNLVRGHGVFLAAALFTLSACGVEPIVHGIDEKQANDIVVLLSDSNIDGTKTMVDSGRDITYTISVPGKLRLEALRILKTHDFPKRNVRGYGEVFSESGLIPTAAEERAKRLSAVEGEIEKQLRLVESVLDVEVNIVMPEESALRTTEDTLPTTTASVTVKYLPGKGGAKPLSEPQIQAVVAAAVEKLTPDHVVVVMTPAIRSGSSMAAAGGKCPECPPGRGPLGGLPAKTQNMIIAGWLIFILILSLGLVFAQMRLKTVRGRLIRLQNEIARARRKSSTGSLPAAN